jgi:hypothetical protein
MEVSLTQALNMEVKLVPAERFRIGAEISDAQLLNIDVKLVPA